MHYPKERLYGKKSVCFEIFNETLYFLPRYLHYIVPFLEFEKKIMGIFISLLGNKNKIVKSSESYFRKYIIIIHVTNNTKFE